MNESPVRRPVDLDRLIQKRKLENRNKWKMSIQVNLKTIQDRMKITEVEPLVLPNGAFEQLKICDVWKDVLKYLSNPSDITSAYYSCQTFAKQLEPKMTLVLFPKVLNILKTNEYLYSYLFEEMNCYDVRRVCKAWKEAFDMEIFESNSHTSDWFLTNDLSQWTIRKPGLVCTLSSLKSVDRAMTCMPSSCLLRKLRVVVWDYTDNRSIFYNGDDINPFCQKVLEFLSLHGDEVHFFWYHWRPCDQPREAYLRLQSMLHLLPNLKGLFLDGVTFAETEENIRALREALHAHPFPVMESLEHFECFVAENPFFLAQLFRNCVNLKSLLSHNRFAEVVNKGMLRAMRALNLQRYEEYRDSSNQLQSLIMSSNENGWRWPLKILAIELNLKKEGETNKSSVVFPALNQYRNTLQSLRLVWTGIKIDDPNIRLDLPHLKFLSVHDVNSGQMETFSFDDMLYLRSLEHLQVILKLWEEWDDGNDQVKVFSCLENNQMRNSNIWDCFPNLKKIETDWFRQVFYRHSR